MTISPETLDHALRLRMEIERMAGAPMFLGVPDRWYDRPTWRCLTGHVSERFLKTDDGDRCMACGEPVRITFPEDYETDPPSPPTSLVVLPSDLALSLVDEDGCVFDHYGGCQSHGYLSLQPGETCPQAALRALLGLPALPTVDDRLSHRQGPHSRACGISQHEHGPSCHTNCPTCHGR